MIEARHIHFDHDSETKDYDLYFVTCRETGKGAVLRRYGALGAFGQTMCEVGTDTWARKDFSKQQRTRGKRGYFATADEEHSLATQDEVVSVLGRTLWNKHAAALGDVLEDIEGSSSMPLEPPQPREPRVSRAAEWGSW